MKLKKSLIILFLLLLYSNSSNIYIDTYNAMFNHTTENSIVTFANTEWIYKTENGKTYRRLYDFGEQKWIGDWELC